MKNIDLDILWLIAEKGLLLDNIEMSLRLVGEDEKADLLMKMQQDVGVEIDIQMGGECTNDISPGFETAQLKEKFEKVTTARVQNILKRIPGNMILPEDRTEFDKFIEVLFKNEQIISNNKKFTKPRNPQPK